MPHHSQKVMFPYSEKKRHPNSRTRGRLGTPAEVVLRLMALKHLIPAIEKHREIFGCVPQLAATDAGFFSLENARQAKELGVKRVAVPNKKGRDSARSKEQKQRWFRRAQRWRVGCEGRISVLKRRQGLRRCRYRGLDGMERWVWLGRDRG